MPLVGAAPRTHLAPLPATARLIQRYGTEAPQVQSLAARDAGLAEPVAPGLDITGAELVWAVRHEAALDIADLLDRRTRIGLVPADRAAALPRTREILADHAG